MEPIGCPETSARDCHFMLRNIPEERISHLFRGGSMESTISTISFTKEHTLRKYIFANFRCWCLPFCATSFVLSRFEDLIPKYNLVIYSFRFEQICKTGTFSHSESICVGVPVLVPPAQSEGHHQAISPRTCQYRRAIRSWHHLEAIKEIVTDSSLLLTLITFILCNLSREWSGLAGWNIFF